MNKEIVQYYSDKFTDFKGNERPFCIALVSRPVKLAKEFRDVVAGFAVCHEQDEFSPEVGKKIAYNKATSGDQKLSMVCHGSMMTCEIGELILKTLAKYFISNPEFQISGYLDMQKAYEKAKETKSQEKELSSVELDTLHYLRSLDEDKLKLMIKLVNEK